MRSSTQASGLVRRPPDGGGASREGGPLRKALRRLALWGNLLYVAAAVVALTVLVNLGSAPWQAYANVLLFIGAACAAADMNRRAIRRRGHAGWSGIAILLNAACFAFLWSRPEYAHLAWKALALSVPLLNTAVLADGLLRGRGSREPGTTDA